jgi:hypothetical protein
LRNSAINQRTWHHRKPATVPLGFTLKQVCCKCQHEAWHEKYQIGYWCAREASKTLNTKIQIHTNSAKCLPSMHNFGAPGLGVHDKTRQVLEDAMFRADLIITTAKTS